MDTSPALASPLPIPDRRRPPAPRPPLQPLGPIGLYRTLRRNAIAAWREAAYEEPVLEGRNFLGGFVMVNDPELIRRVFVDNAANYRKDALQLEKLEPAVGRGLLTTEGDDWRLQRRTVAPLFSPPAIAAYLAAMAASVEQMLARWERHDGGALDIAREMTALTYDIISRTVFSHELETPADVMGAAITKYFEAFGRIDLWDVLPLPRWLPRPAAIRARPAQGVFRDEVRRLLDRRRARIAAGASVPDDLVTRLINARDPETGAPLADHLIHDNLVTFIGAGHETTANALAWTLFLLAMFPAEEARLVEEVVRVTRAVPPGERELAQLGVARMVVEETLRLYPPAPFTSREARGADRLGEIAIAAGTRVIIAPWVVHRHRKLWVEPDLFAPERFSAERRGAIPRFAYLPFGAGPRICVGMTFAMQEILLVLAMILRRFRLTLAQGARIEPLARITLRPAHGLPMMLARR
jgi:cytochrome P450